MMQEHFCALYVFTVQRNGGVATPPPPYLSTPTPGEGNNYTPRSCIKMTAKDAGQLLKTISSKNRAF